MVVGYQTGLVINPPFGYIIRLLAVLSLPYIAEVILEKNDF